MKAIPFDINKPVKTKKDVERFFRHLYRVEQANFHPDDDLTDYVDNDGNPSWDKEHGELLNKRMEESFTAIEKANKLGGKESIYEVGMRLHPMKKKLGLGEEKKKGGKIGFKNLARKASKFYQEKGVPKKEADVIGNKVAGAVKKRMEQSYAKGGAIPIGSETRTIVEGTNYKINQVTTPTDDVWFEVKNNNGTTIAFSEKLSAINDFVKEKMQEGGKFNAPPKASSPITNFEHGKRYYHPDILGSYTYDKNKDLFKHPVAGERKLEPGERSLLRKSRDEFAEGGDLTPLSEEQKRRIAFDIADTQKMLDKELAYSEDLQNKTRITELRTHLTKLENMVKHGWKAPKLFSKGGNLKTQLQPYYNAAQKAEKDGLISYLSVMNNSAFGFTHPEGCTVVVEFEKQSQTVTITQDYHDGNAPEPDDISLEGFEKYLEKGDNSSLDAGKIQQRPFRKLYYELSDKIYAFADYATHEKLTESAIKELNEILKPLHNAQTELSKWANKYLGKWD